MRRLALLTSLAFACGDNLHGDTLPLAVSSELFVVAHPSDDLLLMQPDLLAALTRGGGVTTIYVTVGNGSSTEVDVASRRYEGIKAAYGHALGRTDWRCGVIRIAGHPAEHCRVDGASLVFLGYPDGGKEGEHPSSLLRLWRGQIESAATIASEPTRYDRPGLVATLAAILRATTPATVRTLEVSSTHGRDHPDHQAVGALTVLAIAEANAHPELVAYRGYAISDEPPNKLMPTFDAAFEMLARYAACATDCAACGEACTAPEVGPAHMEWLLRRYAVGFRRTTGGQLRSGAQCLNDGLELVSCTAAPPWTFDTAGELRVHDRCLSVDSTGALSLDLCTGGSPRRFFLDDEGHLLSGTTPPPSVSGEGFLSCLGVTGGRLSLVRCGTERAPTWNLSPASTTTARTTLAITATGRAVRLGDINGDKKADLCAIENGLLCALGDGRGGFLPASRVDVAAKPLAIDPLSLVLGDVDGDLRVDACGRDADGVLCATAASGFVTVHWSPAFSATAERLTTSASLVAVDADADGTADICGFDQNGVICASRGLTFQTVPRSSWPKAAAVVWIADLDGDAQADWCASTSSSPGCAVEANRDITTEGTPWGYANRGMFDIVPANSALVAVADIDGDHRADLCTPHEGRVVCARSQGTAFGPRTTAIATLPDDELASALWLGDLDGDGRMDPCVDLGATIACAVQP